VANAHPDTKAAAEFIAEKRIWKWFVEAITRYFSYFRARIAVNDNYSP